MPQQLIILQLHKNQFWSGTSLPTSKLRALGTVRRGHSQQTPPGKRCESDSRAGLASSKMPCGLAAGRTEVTFFSRERRSAEVT
jgi:hypothetical protein